MAEERPTDIAKNSFGRVKMHSNMAHTEAIKIKGPEAMYRSHTSVALNELGAGLEAMTVGLRATYLLLEEVKRLLEQRR